LKVTPDGKLLRHPSEIGESSLTLVGALRFNREFTKPLMSVHFYCDAPQALLAAFNTRIAQIEQKDKITTWELHSDGQHYTHLAAAWNRKAWMRPAVQTGRLTFNIVRSKDSSVSSVAYAYYHGHLIETFLTHFDGLFSNASASAMPEADDRVSD
jgi:hypothetical protein